MKKIVSKKFSNFAILFGVLLIFFSVSSCLKKETNNTMDTGIITDIDGNKYTTVKIGKQLWMAENLRVKRFNNGDSIHYIGNSKVGLQNDFDSARWRLSADSAAFCILGNRDSADINFNGKNYGLLYNWYAIKDKGNRSIAPTGWHIPTDEEWKKLELFLGMNKDTVDNVSWRGTLEGSKLKREPNGSAHSIRAWASDGNTSEHNVWGTNESGFSALGGSCMMFTGKAGNPGLTGTGFWWTSSEQDNQKAWYRYLDNSKTNIFRYYGSKTYGFSIRCIKDDNTEN